MSAYGFRVDSRRVEKERILDAIGVMLECAEAAVEWKVLRTDLSRLSVPVLHSLKYRIERALQAAEAEGALRAEQGGTTVGTAARRKRWTGQD